MEKDDRFDLATTDEEKEGGIRTMCDVIDRYLKEGEAISIEKGEAIGLKKVVAKALQIPSVLCTRAA